MADNNSVTLEQRRQWLGADDRQLDGVCRLKAFKASGRGGQKRNKTSSAVRLIHLPTGISVTDCSGRSQHHNRHNALQKLRLKLAFELRCQPLHKPDNLNVSLKNPAYPLLLASLLDILQHHNFDLKASAEFLNISTAKLIKIVARDGTLWQYINQQRQRHNLPPLKYNH